MLFYNELNSSLWWADLCLLAPSCWIVRLQQLMLTAPVIWIYGKPFGLAGTFAGSLATLTTAISLAVPMTAVWDERPTTVKAF